MIIEFDNTKNTIKIEDLYKSLTEEFEFKHDDMGYDALRTENDLLCMVGGMLTILEKIVTADEYASIESCLDAHVDKLMKNYNDCTCAEDNTTHITHVTRDIFKLGYE